MSQPPARSKKANRLLKEKSPYLQQHAYNPVNWFPWGREALAAAKERDKPIFLSIGYSTCHWCHVMERESFENEDVASYLNEHFICVKVDREERPDLDALYMEAVQALTGMGGWPMSVWLTPDLKPFYGGTYYPPDDRYGRPGFKTLLKRLKETWEEKRETLLDTANQLATALFEFSRDTDKEKSPLPSSKDLLQGVFINLSQNFDPVEGGFGPPPKFPMPPFLKALLLHHVRTGSPESLSMAELTMTKMIQGGIFDQLGGGFSRYSTDALWLVPHFEKMLYDNAQLILILADLHRITGNPLYKKALESTIGYIQRDMTHADGAFFSAEDADSEGREGKFYVWKLNEVRDAVGPDLFELAAAYYDLSPSGNFRDPHHDEGGLNVLTGKTLLKKIAEKFQLTEAAAAEKIKEIETRLFTARSKRLRPHLDDKVLTGWNGLMIGAVAEAGAALNRPDWIDAGVKSAVFIQKNLFDKETGALYKRWREGEKKIPAHQPDYAFFIQGLIRLYEAGAGDQWLVWARDLQERHNTLFQDKEAGGYFMTEPSEDLLYRIKERQDNVVPSGMSVAAWNGLKLGDYFNREDFKEAARETLAANGRTLTGHPTALCEMILAVDYDAGGMSKFVLANIKNEIRPEFEKIIHEFYLPGKQIVRLPADSGSGLMAPPEFSSTDAANGKPAVYLCRNFTCEAPIFDSMTLKERLGKR